MTTPDTGLGVSMADVEAAMPHLGQVLRDASITSIERCKVCAQPMADGGHWRCEDLAALRAEVERLTAAVDTYEQECRKLNQTIDTLADDVTRLARDRDEARDAREFSDGVAAAALEDRDRWRTKYETMANRRDRWRDKAKKRKKQRDEANRDAEDCRVEANHYAMQLRGAVAAGNTLAAERDAMRPVVEAAGAEVAEMLAWQAGGEYRRLTDPEDVALVKAWRAYEAWRAGNCSAETETQPNGHVRVTEVVAYQNSSAPLTTSAGSTLHVRWDNDPDPDSPVTSVWESGDAPNPASAEDDEVYRVAAKAWADGFDEMSTVAQLRAAVAAVRPIIEAQALRRAADRIEDGEPYAAAQLRDWADETGGASRG